MKISPTYQYNNIRTPVFKSNERQIFNKTGKIINRNVTYFFRTDLDWHVLAHFLKNKYNKTDKVNVFNYGCSDGSESYTLVLSLLTRLGNDMSKKFFPIISKDSDPYIIKRAQSGCCNIYNSDLYAINYYTQNRFNDYFRAIPCTDKNCDLGITPKKPLQNKIIFEQANILDDLVNLPDKNNVIFCRNFWHYMGEENYDTLAKQLYEKTKNNGLVIIGDYDEKNGVSKALRQHGFEETYVQRIFQTKFT